MQKILLTKKNNKGFSLVEVVMAIGVLSIGLLAVSQLFSKNLKEMMEIRDQTTAISLAQEGVELVRNYHDNRPPVLNSGIFGVDINPSGNVNLSDEGSPYTLHYYSASTGLGIFGHTGGSATKFQRKIIINGTSSSKTVTSLVSWDGADPEATINCNTANKCVYATMQLFD